VRARSRRAGREALFAEKREGRWGWPTSPPQGRLGRGEDRPRPRPLRRAGGAARAAPPLRVGAGWRSCRRGACAGIKPPARTQRRARGPRRAGPGGRGGFQPGGSLFEPEIPPSRGGARPASRPESGRLSCRRNMAGPAFWGFLEMAVVLEPGRRRWRARGRGGGVLPTLVRRGAAVTRAKPSRSSTSRGPGRGFCRGFWGSPPIVTALAPGLSP